VLLRVDRLSMEMMDKARGGFVSWVWKYGRYAGKEKCKAKQSKAKQSKAMGGEGAREDGGPNDNKQRSDLQAGSLALDN
jgi:hypothetical protein